MTTSAFALHILVSHGYKPPRRCTSTRRRGLRAAFTVESTRAYLAARRPAPIEVDRLEEILAVPTAPVDATLLLAARLGDVDTVNECLADGSDVNVQDTEGSTAGMRAASRGHVGVLRALLSTGKMDLELANNWGYDTCVYVGSVKNSMPNEHADMLQLLKDAGIDDPEGRADKRWTKKRVYTE